MTRRLAIIGDGKMGQAVAELAPKRGWEIVAHFGEGGDAQGRPVGRESLNGADVAIEFTVPDAAAANIVACATAGTPVVVGTTGWLAEFDEVSAEVIRVNGGLLTAANFSLGVNLFLEIAREAARRFRNVPGFGVHLVETHHDQKKDAPSGTALAIAAAMEGPLGAAVPTSSVRVGHVPGTHDIIFDGAFEQVRLTHEARDRRVFAEGALTAAAWMVGKRGIFTMRDLLALDGVPQ